MIDECSPYIYKIIENAVVVPENAMTENKIIRCIIL